MRLIQLGVLALVTIILAVFVLRPILASRRLPVADDRAPTQGPVAQFKPELAGAAGSLALPGSPEGHSGAPVIGAGIVALSPEPRADQRDDTVEIADPVTRLKTLVEARQPDTLEILRNWLADETAGERV